MGKELSRVLHEGLCFDALSRETVHCRPFPDVIANNEKIESNRASWGDSRSNG
jgi:hypothetical protein